MALWLSGPGYRIRVRDLQAVVPLDAAHPEDGSTILVSGVIVHVGEGAEQVCSRLDDVQVQRARAKVGFCSSSGGGQR